MHNGHGEEKPCREAIEERKCSIAFGEPFPGFGDDSNDAYGPEEDDHPYFECAGAVQLLMVNCRRVALETSCNVFVT